MSAIAASPKAEVIQHPVTTQFQANWPKALDPAQKTTAAKIAYYAWNLFSLIVFPIALIRITRWAVKQLALIPVIPGRLEPKASIEYLGEEFLDKHQGTSIKIKTPDGVELDGAFFPGKNREKAIIATFGNAMQWELCDYMADLFKPLETSILLINPRGIGESTGSRDEKKAALDVYSAYDYLIKTEKLKPEDIVTVGESLGAAYGTMGAAIVQQEYPNAKVSVVNCRSFSTLQEEIKQIFGGGIIGSIIKIAAKLIGLEMHVKKSWDILKGKKFAVIAKEDRIISDAASLYKAVKKDPNSTVTDVLNKKGGHCDDYDATEKEKLHGFIKDALCI